MIHRELKNLVMPGYGEVPTLPSKGVSSLPIRGAMPGLVILVHGVNDVGEAFPYQERGLCEGLNARLFRKDLAPGEWALPPVKEKGAYTAADVHPDPDKVYFQRKPDQGTSPVIPFYWGYRANAETTDTTQRHGEYIDASGNRVDKRFGKNGGPFANATTNIPDMFGPGFNRNWIIRRIDPEDGTHPLMPAPERTYMVLAAQRLAALLRIIRTRSPKEPVNIVAHSQGCFVTLLAHAMLAKEGNPAMKADTVILNNPPYSLDEPFFETFQTGARQQTEHARAETLRKIIADYITASPATQPAFADTQKLGSVGKDWRHDQRKERDNRGKLYLYFSPDDGTVGLPNIQGIGWWGVNDKALKGLGSRFFQRMFASPDGANPQAPPIGAAPASYRLSFKWNILGTWPRTRMINGEELATPFTPQFGPAMLSNGPIDAAIAVTNPYDKKGQEGIRLNETREQAQARWLNTDGKNSFHSSIVSNSNHSKMATAYDLSIGSSDIVNGEINDLIKFLRAVADWRTNWDLNGGSNDSDDSQDASFPPPSLEVMAILKGIAGSKNYEIIEGNFNYYALSGLRPSELPEFTKGCLAKSLEPYVISETVKEKNVENQ